jgi:benzylsuccinate CoA-transferase BbsF subunit
VRIADFTWIGAGAYTTKLLADLGAEVIKVESSSRLDSLRSSPPFRNKIPGLNRSGYFADRNTGKRSITVDAKHPRAGEVLDRLIVSSDIIANNFSPGTMERLGLGYDSVRSIRPDIIYLEMSMQGQDGPWRDHLGFGLTIGALTGLHYLTGTPGREAIGTGTNYPDHVPNPGHAAFAVLAALRHKRKTGEGQRIDIAQTETMLALLAPDLMRWLVNGEQAQARGHGSDIHAPHGVYPCADDAWIAIAVAGEDEWRALCGSLDSPEWQDDPRWTTFDGRRHDSAALDAEIGAATRAWRADDLMATLQSRGVSAGTVQSSADVLDRDPQLAHRQHWRRLPHAELGAAACNAPPFRFGSFEVGPTTAAPLLGEHVREVCEDMLGLARAEVDELVAEGVLR